MAIAVIIGVLGSQSGRPAAPSGSADPAPVSASASASRHDLSSASRSRSVAPPASTIVQPGSALAALATIAVQGRAPRTGYDRAQFGSAWTDDNDAVSGHNGCDTRNDILRRDLTDIVLKANSNGCSVLTGRLHDPYTGQVIDFVRGPDSAAVQIDHVVALSDAWQTGAQRLDRRARISLANDPLNLLAVDGAANQRKGDGDAATWLPPNKAFRCAYVARQVAVKARYRLWMTPAERDASVRVLSRCAGQNLPVAAAIYTPATPATADPSIGTATASPTNCKSPHPADSENRMNHHRMATAATVLAVFAGCLTSTAADAKPAHRFRNCTDMHRTYPHGVGKVGARDKTKSKPVTTFTRSNALYAANKASDRDRDGIACEKR
ncbi:MAG: DUF1524 domain-containing protein [Jatrophihabitans sp.]